MLWLAVATFLLLALISFTPNDPSWSHVSSVNLGEVSNLAGMAGAWVADILYTVFGAASWLFIAIAGYEAWALWREKLSPDGAIRALGYLFLVLGVSGFVMLLAKSWLLSGVIGQLIGSALSGWFSTIGAMLFLAVLLLMTVSFIFNIRWQAGLKRDTTLPDTSVIPQSVLETGVDFDEEATAPSITADGQFATRLKNKLATLKASATKPVSQAASQTSPLTSSADLAPHLHESDLETSQLPLVFMGDNAEAEAKAKPATKLVVKAKPKPLDSFLQVVGLQHATRDMAMGTFDQDGTHEASQSAQNDELSIPQAIDPLTQKLDEQLKKEIINLPSNAVSPSVNMAETAASQNVANAETVKLPPETVIAPTFTITPPFRSQTRLAPALTTPEIAIPEIQSPVRVETLDKVEVESIDTEAALESFEPVETGENDLYVTPVHGGIDATTEENFASDDIQDTPHITPNARIAENSVSVATIAEVATDTNGTTQSSANVSSDIRSSVTDLHNDILFQAKSRAMQTAAYRASLSPLPDLSILDLPEADRKPSYTSEQLRQMAALLEIKLQEFNVKSTVVNAEPGPVVTRFEVDLAAGIKASKVTGISRDLARSLSMASVRVVEVIAGKPYIGIEVPNPTREMVRLIELLETEAYRDPNSHISMAMGKDIAGRPVITDLAKAPHILVAGTTGSGKSVLVNSMLLSILLKYTPDQLRMILIDPKQLELANYNDIPHLLTPVVTDMTEAASALSWCVAEMERRYQLMSLFKVRKLDEFNKKVLNAEALGHPLLDPLWRPNDSVSVTSPPKIKTLPLIVIVADEFADMIMQVGKQAEELITRLAQKSRAAGIHLILATQRPSVDVITGLIKANIPARAALRVNSKIDSRTILDAGGAEDMLGNGDMLFLGPGQIEPNRVHGAYVSDSEVNRVCDAWRERGAPDYIDNMFDSFDLTSPSGGGDSGGISTGDQDAFYDEAVAFVLETRKVSASSIQRKFSIGYNRAARLVDAMEEAGLVSALGKNGKRELLM